MYGFVKVIKEKKFFTEKNQCFKIYISLELVEAEENFNFEFIIFIDYGNVLQK